MRNTFFFRDTLVTEVNTETVSTDKLSNSNQFSIEDMQTPFFRLFSEQSHISLFYNCIHDRIKFTVKVENIYTISFLDSYISERKIYTYIGNMKK